MYNFFFFFLLLIYVYGAQILARLFSTRLNDVWSKKQKKKKIEFPTILAFELSACNQPINQPINQSIIRNYFSPQVYTRFLLSDLLLFCFPIQYNLVLSIPRLLCRDWLFYTHCCEQHIYMEQLTIYMYVLSTEIFSRYIIVYNSHITLWRVVCRAEPRPSWELGPLPKKTRRRADRATLARKINS